MNVFVALLLVTVWLEVRVLPSSANIALRVHAAHKGASMAAALHPEIFSPHQ
jgi:hypothetical protein